MNYGTIYTLPFQSMKGVDYIVEIQKENYTGRSIELKGSGDAPFSVELADEDFLYTPTRFSTATIRVVGNDYLQSLYSTGYQQYRVNFKQGGRVVWTGFITPELYTQDYTSTLFDLEIQCVSAMSALEYIKYKEIGEKRAFVSLWDLLKKCVTESRGSYSSVYIPHVYAASATDYNTSANVLQTMTVSEQNFFDEDDEPMTLKEVLEEVCKLLNWTCADWRGDLYFVDVDHKGSYRKYSADLNSFKSVSANTVKVQDIGFAGSDHTLDILGGYNKAVVRVSNYCVSKVFPEEDFDKLKVIEKYKYTNVPGWENRTEKVYIFLEPSKYFAHHYIYNKFDLPDFGITQGWEEVNNKWFNELKPEDKVDSLGAYLMKYSVINFSDGVPDSYNYNFDDIICLNVSETTFYPNNTNETILLPIGYTLLDVGHNLPCAAYPAGAISINMDIKLPFSIKLDDNIYKKFNFQPILMYFKLQIGKHYFNGTGWVESETTFSVEFENNGRTFENGEYIRVKNTKTIEMPYNGMSGFIIPIKDITPIGTPSLKIVGFFARGSGVYDYPMYQYGCMIKGLSVEYQKEDETVWAEDDSSDRYYENVVNESYVNPLDEIEFKISSYNNDGACYSKVMLGDNYLTDNLYSAVEGGTVRPEEHLIRRIVNQYSATKNKLTQVLIYSDSITPITTVTDKFQPDKRFAVTGGVIDFAAESFNCTIIQNGN